MGSWYGLTEVRFGGASCLVLKNTGFADSDLMAFHCSPQILGSRIRLVMFGDKGTKRYFCEAIALHGAALLSGASSFSTLPNLLLQILLPDLG